MGPVVTEGAVVSDSVSVIFISLRRHYPVRFVRSTAPSRPLSTLGVRSRGCLLFGGQKRPHATLLPPEAIRAVRAQKPAGKPLQSVDCFTVNSLEWEDEDVQQPKQ